MAKKSYSEKTTLKEHQVELTAFGYELEDFLAESRSKHHLSVAEVISVLETMRFSFFREREKYAEKLASEMAERCNDDIPEGLKELFDKLDELAEILAGDDDD